MAKHDEAYKLLFSHPEVVRDLILGFVPDEWLHGLDYATLQKVPANFVTDRFQHREADVIWRVRVKEDWVYSYLLIEFQSRTDHWMAVRMMTYVGLLYQDLIRRGHVLPGRRLPPVLPIVLHTGERVWRAAHAIEELIPPAPGLVAKYLPKMRYLVIDESRYSDDELAGLKNLMAVIMRIDNPANPEALRSAAALLGVWLEDHPELKRTFAMWLRTLLRARGFAAPALHATESLEDLEMGWSQVIKELREQREQGREEGMAQGLEKGLDEGRAQGAALLLQRQLSRRFGELPPWALQRITKATQVELERWGERVLDAESLTAVFDA